MFLAVAFLLLILLKFNFGSETMDPDILSDFFGGSLSGIVWTPNSAADLMDFGGLCFLLEFDRLRLRLPYFSLYSFYLEICNSWRYIFVFCKAEIWFFCTYSSYFFKMSIYVIFPDFSADSSMVWTIFVLSSFPTLIWLFYFSLFCLSFCLILLKFLEFKLFDGVSDFSIFFYLN